MVAAQLPLRSQRILSPRANELVNNLPAKVRRELGQQSVGHLRLLAGCTLDWLQSLQQRNQNEAVLEIAFAADALDLQPMFHTVIDGRHVAEPAYL